MWQNLSLAQKVAQMVVVRTSGLMFDEQRRYPKWEASLEQLAYYLQDLGIGGLIFFGGSAADLGDRSQLLQSWAKIPLLMSADIEEGVGQRFAGPRWFPPPMALGAIAAQDLIKAEKYAEQMGLFTAQEALAIGLNWILGPVVDVNNNPDNPVINVRSFGETPELVSKLAQAFIRGTQGYPVLTCAKHFPGHGDTGVDSHWELPILMQDEKRLEELELLPFKGAIASGVDSVMSAHLLINCWDDQYPATLSHKILTGKLREKLGFSGLIVTDALVMGAIASRYTVTEAAILAVEAGADILLMPEEPELVINAVVEAVNSGRIPASRIDDSLQKIWQAKSKVFPNLANDLDAIKSDNLGDKLTSNQVNPRSLLFTNEAQETVNHILQDSVKMGGILPWQPSKDGLLRNLIIVDNLLNCDFLGHHTPALLLPPEYGPFQHQLIDSSASNLDEPHPPSGRLTLLQIFVRGNPFGTSAKLTELAQNWLRKLIKNGELGALIVYGSPYAFAKFRADLPENVPYIFTYGQMPAAQALAIRALLG